MTLLCPMPPDAFAEYREASVSGYAEDNVAAGRWPESGALERAYADFDRNLPQGVATPDHFIYQIKEGGAGEVVGVLWFAIMERNGVRSAFVYDLEVKPAYRRMGHASAAFKILEEKVRELGLLTIGLHVFAHNADAQRLYASLGYAVTGVNMLKHLEQP